MKVTNETKGPKSVNTTKGAVILQPGESKDLDISEGDANALKETNFLSPEGYGHQPGAAAQAETLRAMGTQAPGPAGDETAEQLVDRNTADQLREIAETEGADIGEAKTKADLAAAIIANREATA